MIIGGVGGVCRTGDTKTGYQEWYFPVLVTVGTEPVDEAFSENQPVKYSASTRIRNVADNAWVDLADVTYFQVAGKKDGSGSANLTIRKPDVWNVDGVSYPDLLRPSARLLQILCTITIKGTSYTVPIFNGQITNYNESHGQSGGSISITANASSLGLDRRTPAGLSRQTAYRLILDELAASGLFTVGQVPVIMFADYAFGEDGSQAYENLLALIEGVAPVVVNVVSRQTGGVIIDQRGAETEETAAFTINDDNQVSLNRTLGAAGSFNTITVQGLVGSTLTFQTVSDATDVARRGTVRYPWNYGSTRQTLAINVAGAEEWIAEMTRGRLSVGLQLNPFIAVGTILGFDSSRLFITSGRARVGAFTHQYRYGSASTQLTDVAVLA